MLETAKALESVQPIPWCLDVHSHAHVLEKQVSDIFLQLQHNDTKQQAKKAYISPEAYSIVMLKAVWFKNMAYHSRSIRWLKLRVAFFAWQLGARRVHFAGDHAARAADRHQQLSECSEWLSQARVHRAFAEQQRNRLHEALKQKLKIDKFNYIEQAVKDTQHEANSGNMKQFFAKVSNLRPRPPKGIPMLKLRDGGNATCVQEVQETFCQHFATLHAATVVPHEQLVQQVRATDEAYWEHITEEVFEQLPTHADIVSLARSTRAGKASGPDGVPPGLLKFAGPVSCRGCGRSSSRPWFGATSRYNGGVACWLLCGNTRGPWQRPHHIELSGLRTPSPSYFTGGFARR